MSKRDKERLREILSIIGELENTIRNDRNPNRLTDTINLLEEISSIVIEITEAK